MGTQVTSQPKHSCPWFPSAQIKIHRLTQGRLPVFPKIFLLRLHVSSSVDRKKKERKKKNPEKIIKRRFSSCQVRAGHEERMRAVWADFRKCGKTENWLWIWTELDLNPKSICVGYRTLGMSSSSVFSSVKQVILTMKIHCRDQG